MSSGSRKQFRERVKHLFNGYSFKFEGFPPNMVNEFEKIVKDLGAEVKDDATYTFGSNITLKENNSIPDKEMYNTCYILHSLRAEKPLDIEKYRFSAKDICILCLEDFEDLPSDKINTACPNKINKIRIIDEAKIQTKRSMENDENIETRGVNSQGSAGNSKKLKTHDKNDKDVLFSVMSKVNTFFNQNEKSMKNVDIQDDNSDDDLPIAIAHRSGYSKKKCNNTVMKKVINLDESSATISFSSSDEEVNITNEKAWWLSHEYSEKQLCKVESCSLQPDPHLNHDQYTRILNLTERRVLIAYLIKTKNIHMAKGQKVFREMHDDGYLTHRSLESLRNCFRRRILPNIGEYNLPANIEAQFANLRS